MKRDPDMADRDPNASTGAPKPIVKSYKPKDKEIEPIFNLGEEVEVLQNSKDFRGCWCVATVIMVKPDRREVEYKHIFDNQGVNKLRESFSVLGYSKAASFSSSNPNNVNNKNLGSQFVLRPRPPKFEINELKNTFRKGLCVDAFLSGAWWEGFLLKDLEDDESYVEVCLFHTKIESYVHFKNLRVSMTWKQSTDTWDFKGYHDDEAMEDQHQKFGMHAEKCVAKARKLTGGEVNIKQEAKPASKSTISKRGLQLISGEKKGDKIADNQMKDSAKPVKKITLEQDSRKPGRRSKIAKKNQEEPYWQNNEDSSVTDPKQEAKAVKRTAIARRKQVPSGNKKEDKRAINQMIEDKRNEVRDFLFSQGYTMEFHHRPGRSREAVYISPTGRRFYSITTACKAWKKKRNLPLRIWPGQSKEEKLLAIYENICDVSLAPCHERALVTYNVKVKAQTTTDVKGKAGNASKVKGKAVNVSKAKGASSINGKAVTNSIVKGGPLTKSMVKDGPLSNSLVEDKELTTTNSEDVKDSPCYSDVEEEISDCIIEVTDSEDDSSECSSDESSSSSLSNDDDDDEVTKQVFLERTSRKYNGCNRDNGKNAGPTQEHGGSKHSFNGHGYLHDKSMSHSLHKHEENTMCFNRDHGLHAHYKSYGIEYSSHGHIHRHKHDQSLYSFSGHGHRHECDQAVKASCRNAHAYLHGHEHEYDQALNSSHKQGQRHYLHGHEHGYSEAVNSSYKQGQRHDLHQHILHHDQAVKHSFKHIPRHENDQEPSFGRRNDQTCYSYSSHDVQPRYGDLNPSHDVQPRYGDLKRKQCDLAGLGPCDALGVTLDSYNSMNASKKPKRVSVDDKRDVQTTNTGKSRQLKSKRAEAVLAEDFTIRQATKTRKRYI